MKLFAVHIKRGAEPIMLPEGFAWGAFLFGPLWLAAQRAWIAAAVSLGVYVLVVALSSPPLAGILILGVALLLGLQGHDLRGWALDHRGFTLIHIVAARGPDDAWMRLIAHRPDLVAQMTSDIP